jgi:hypothetical protein
MKLTFFLSLSLILFTSCVKKYGCAKEDAINFDEKANKYDGSCLYESKGYFSCSGETYDLLVANGIQSITLSLGNDIVYNNIPVADLSYIENYSCESSEYSFTRLLLSTEEYFILSCYDQDNYLIATKRIRLESYNCNAIPIPYY